MQQENALPVRSPRERGIAVLLSGVMMFFTIGTVGLAFDGGVAYLVKGRLMAAVDAASLGAARGLNLGQDEETARAYATSSSTRFFNANFPRQYMGIDPTKTTITPTFTNLKNNGSPTGVLQVDVIGSVTAPTYFMNLFNVSGMKVSATGTATRRTLVMMMILDVSGSMQSRQTVGTIPTTVSSTTRSCDAMVYAASKFLDYFSSYDYIGAVTFNSSAQVVYAPSNNFKRADGAGLNAVLRNLNCGGATNTAPSINLAWNAIRNVGLKLAMNEILLFTDGMPNLITGNWPVRTQRGDNRFGPGFAYNISPPPTNTQLLYLDARDPFSATTNDLSPNITLSNLAAPYTAAQQTRIDSGFTPRYGDSSFLPLTTAQFNTYTALPSATRNALGWHLAAAAGPYNRRWIQDTNAPTANYRNCINTNTNTNTVDRGVTWMCYDMPLPSTSTTPGTFYGGMSQSSWPSYEPRFGPKSNSFVAPVTGESTTNPPTGFVLHSTNGSIAASQTVAFVPALDSKGNNNYGFRDNWVYNVNQGCAPAGTTLPNGNTDLCKNRGGLWSNYPSAGLGTNKFNAGPYVNSIRADLPNIYPAVAMNSAVSAAARTKADTEYNIRFDCVYLIGTEDNVDREFLQIISNVQIFQPTIFDGAGASCQGNNPLFNANHQQGLWYYTTNPADLANLFAQIAGSLLRLSA
ncbi:MAG: VWA domain-containing protein [Acidobacteria bacterium]|nr:VWA domain-containing protein [Acidobacteriota bacterium]